MGAESGDFVGKAGFLGILLDDLINGVGMQRPVQLTLVWDIPEAAGHKGTPSHICKGVHIGLEQKL